MEFLEWGLSLLTLERLLTFDLPLKLHQPLDEGLGTRWAPRNIHINRDEPVNPLKNRVAAIHPPRRGTCPHRDAPLGFRHLIPDSLDRESHLVSHCSSDDHDVGLAGRKPHHLGSKTGDVKSGRCGRHELNRAAREPHRHGPQRVLPHPVDGSIDSRNNDVPFDLGIVGGLRDRKIFFRHCFKRRITLKAQASTTL